MQIGSIKLSTMDIGIIIATVITGVIHLFLGITSGDMLFILNGLGYFALLLVYLLPNFTQWRGWLTWLFIGYAALTIILYFVVNGQALQSTLGLVTKLVEVILIVLLFINRAK